MWRGAGRENGLGIELGEHTVRWPGAPESASEFTLNARQPRLGQADEPGRASLPEGWHPCAGVRRGHRALRGGGLLSPPAGRVSTQCLGLATS